MCKFLPKPTHTLHVMRRSESSLQFIVVSNNNMKWSVEELEWCEDIDNDEVGYNLMLGKQRSRKRDW